MTGSMTSITLTSTSDQGASITSTKWQYHKWTSMTSSKLQCDKWISMASTKWQYEKLTRMTSTKWQYDKWISMTSPSDIMKSELHLLLSISSRTQVRIFRQRVNTEKNNSCKSYIEKKKGNGISHVGFSDFGHIIVTSPQELFCHMTGKWSYHPKKNSILFLFYINN